MIHTLDIWNILWAVFIYVNLVNLGQNSKLINAQGLIRMEFFPQKE